MKNVELNTTELYCSDFCGRGCTKAEYDLAVKESDALAVTLGEGWTTRVWENLGWHSEAISPCQRLRVNGTIDGGYHCGICEPGTVAMNWYGKGSTPFEAIENAFQNLMEDIGFLFRGKSIDQIINNNRQFLKG